MTRSRLAAESGRSFTLRQALEASVTGSIAAPFPLSLLTTAGCGRAIGKGQTDLLIPHHVGARNRPSYSEYHLTTATGYTNDEVFPKMMALFEGFSFFLAYFVIRKI